MKILAILLIASLVPMQFAFSQDFDWRSLNEKADKIALEGILSNIKGKEDSADDLYLSGLVYLNLHKDKEAGEVFERMFRIYPKMQEAKWGIAEVLRRKHRLDESQKLLEEVIKSEPKFWPAYISLAYIKYIKMDFNDAVRLAHKVTREKRANVDLSNYVRGYLLVGAGKGIIAYYGGPFSKIINGSAVFSNFKKARILQPDSAAVMFGMGSFYLLAPAIAGGSLDKAEEYLRKAVSRDPLFADSYVRLGQLYKLKGDNDKYEGYLNKALEVDPLNELALDVKSGKCRFICITK